MEVEICFSRTFDWMKLLTRCVMAAIIAMHKATTLNPRITFRATKPLECCDILRNQKAGVYICD